MIVSVSVLLSVCKIERLEKFHSEHLGDVHPLLHLSVLWLIASYSLSESWAVTAPDLTEQIAEHYSQVYNRA